MADNINNILDRINNLQTLEQKNIKELDVLTSSPSFTVTDNVRQLINNINDLSDTRTKLFRTIDETYKVVGSSVRNSRSDLVDQITLVETVEDQLTKVKTNMHSLQNRNDTQMRLVQINNYYGNRYEYQTKLLKKVIILCVILVIIFLLNKKGILPAILFKYIVSIVLGLGIYSIISSLWDIYTRNSMNFDEYNWDYEYPSSGYPSIMQYNRDHMIDLTIPLMALIGNVGVCVGETCCSSDLKYDEKTKQCIIPNTIRAPVYAPIKRTAPAPAPTPPAPTPPPPAPAPPPPALEPAPVKKSNARRRLVETFTTKQLNSSVLIKDNEELSVVSDNEIKPFSYGNDFASL